MSPHDPVDAPGGRRPAHPAHAVRPARGRGAAARAVVLAAGLCWPCACSAPPLLLASDGPRYVDGRLDERDVLPFRYYGTTVVDVVPADTARGSPDWQRRPVREYVAVPPPVAPWLFPFDLPVELLQRVFATPAPQAAEVKTAPTPSPVAAGFLPGGLQELRERAAAARVR